MSDELSWLEFFEDRERLYADFYLEFAQQNARRDPEAYDQLEAESGNLLRAADWLGEHDEVDGILRLAETLWQESDFLRTRGYLQRGLPLLEQACKAARQIGDRKAEFGCLVGLAFIQFAITNHPQALPLFERMLTLAEEIGNPRMRAQAYLGMARFQLYLGKLNHGKAYCEQALELYCALKDADGEINVRTVLGELLSLQNDFENAKNHLVQGLSLAKNQPTLHGEMQIHFSLGYTEALAENWEQAIFHFELATNLAKSTGDRFIETRGQQNLGEAWLALGNPDRAIELLEAALEGQSTSDDILTQAIVRFHLAKAYNATNQFDRSLEQLKEVAPLSQAPMESGLVAEAEWIKAHNHLKLGNLHLARLALIDFLKIAPYHMTDIRQSAEQLLGTLEPVSH